MKKTISLNGEWKLKCMDPYVPLRDHSMETGKPLQGITPWIPAQVPGGVAVAMYQAGYIDYPYFGMNSLKCEWLEHRWWIYRKEVNLECGEAERVLLHFQGVDYKCKVYVNHTFLGGHEGMYEDFSFDITSICKENKQLEIECMILQVPDEMGQIGYTSKTFTQKSRFGYKWDFSTHLVNLGIWQGVELRVLDGAVFDEVNLLTDAWKENADDSARNQDSETSRRNGSISLSGRVCSMNSEGSGSAKKKTIELEAHVDFEGEEVAVGKTVLKEDDTFAMDLEIPNPRLWYPNTMGDQPLYQVEITVLENGRVTDRIQKRCGIRHLEYVQNEGGPAEARCYTLMINGLRVYLKGVNMVPLDHVYGDVSQAHRKVLLKRAAQMNANIVRVWGGGIIETEEFYDLCDEMGILIWQEFIQSSSGIDNMPSHDPHFLELLSRTARSAIKIKRSHTCLAMWSGGNELMFLNGKPVDESDLNIAMLADLVHAMDPFHPFLPSSPSGPNEHISKEKDQSHDVHGWWQYQGNPIHYSYYADSDSLLHSEFGCDGMSSEYTVKRILGNLDGAPQRMTDNDLWRFHGDWWCTYEREEKIFGHSEDLREYIKLSQWMQGEGLRFILEANRRRLPRNSGSIIWQLNEPWPNLSCTNLVDYYLNPKLAYYWTREAFAPVHALLTYRKLDYVPGSLFEGELVLCADSGVKCGKADIEVGVFDLKGREYDRFSYEARILPDCAQKIAKASFTVPAVEEDLFMVRVHLITETEDKSNDYWFSNAVERPYHAALGRKNGAVRAEVLKESTQDCKLKITNTGDETLIHVSVVDSDDAFLLSLDRDYLNLLPGESALITVEWEKRFDLPFDHFETERDTPRLAIQAVGLKEDVRIE